MAKWIIEATVPVQVVVEAESEIEATVEAINKIVNKYNVCYDMICIDSKQVIDEGEDDNAQIQDYCLYRARRRFI